MGRQAYLTRLALGRSAFEAPELDDNGNFILGPHANDSSAHKYVQQFDQKGHPQNLESKEIDRSFRRAKNAVKATTGAVVPKPPKPVNNPHLQQLRRENGWGNTLYAVNCGLLSGSVWWVHSLRRRVQINSSFNNVSLLQAIKSELENNDTWSFLLAGLPVYALWWLIDTIVLEDMVDYILDKIGYRDGPQGDEKYHPWTVTTTLHTALAMLNFPFQALSILQSVFLVPSAPLGLSALMTITRSSQRHLYSSVSLTSIDSTPLLSSCVGFLTTPVVFGLAYNTLYMYVEFLIYIVLRRSIIQPDHPDSLSLQAAASYQPDDTVPGLAIENRATPMSLMASIREEVGRLRKLLEGSPSWFSPSENARGFLSAQLEASLRMESARLFRGLIRSLRREGHVLDDRSRRAFAGAAIADAWLHQGLPDGDKFGDHIDAEQWVSEMVADVVDEGSTATPDPDQLFNLENDNIEAHAESGMVDTLMPPQELGSNGSSPNSRFDTMLSEAATALVHTRMNQTTAVSAEGLRNETPSPGIQRAQSLVSPPRYDRTQTTLDYGRHRPTRFRRTIFHRVTFLSNLPADLFAWQAAALMTTAILIPLESRFVRSLASGIVECSGPRTGASMGVRGIGVAWNDGSLGYMRKMVLLLGLQGLITTGVWGLVTTIVIRIGRSFGWGRL